LSAHGDEDSEPGQRNVTYDPIARERIKSTASRVEDLWRDVDEMSESISDVKKVQIGQNATIQELVAFHKELKAYAKLAIVGLFGAVAIQVLQLVLKKGMP
jgi:hypothetical protein